MWAPVAVDFVTHPVCGEMVTGAGTSVPSSSASSSSSSSASGSLGGGLFGQLAGTVYGKGVGLLSGVKNLLPADKVGAWTVVRCCWTLTVGAPRTCPSLKWLVLSWTTSPTSRQIQSVGAVYRSDAFFCSDVAGQYRYYDPKQRVSASC